MRYIAPPYGLLAGRIERARLRVGRCALLADAVSVWPEAISAPQALESAGSGGTLAVLAVAVSVGALLACAIRLSSVTETADVARLAVVVGLIAPRRMVVLASASKLMLARVARILLAEAPPARLTIGQVGREAAPAVGALALADC